MDAQRQDTFFTISSPPARERNRKQAAFINTSEKRNQDLPQKGRRSSRKPENKQKKEELQEKNQRNPEHKGEMPCLMADKEHRQIHRQGSAQSRQKEKYKFRHPVSFEMLGGELVIDTEKHRKDRKKGRKYAHDLYSCSQKPRLPFSFSGFIRQKVWYHREKALSSPTSKERFQNTV